MSYVTIDDRVDRLEALFGQFLTEMAVLNKRADDRLTRLEQEMREFKDEMRAFKEEMREFKDEMRAAKKELDKKWGDLANKMGPVIEDILAPNLRRLAVDHFQFESILDFSVRRSRRQPDHPEIESEFDVLVVGSQAVILGEAKSTPSLDHADAFAEKAATFYDFFPEYREKRLILVFGSWSIADPIIRRLTQRRIYAMRMGEETMELANAAVLETGAQ